MQFSIPSSQIPAPVTAFLKICPHDKVPSLERFPCLLGKCSLFAVFAMLVVFFGVVHTDEAYSQSIGSSQQQSNEKHSEEKDLRTKVGQIIKTGDLKNLSDLEKLLNVQFSAPVYNEISPSNGDSPFISITRQATNIDEAVSPGLGNYGYTYIADLRADKVVPNAELSRAFLVIHLNRIPLNSPVNCLKIDDFSPLFNAAPVDASLDSIPSSGKNDMHEFKFKKSDSARTITLSIQNQGQEYCAISLLIGFEYTLPKSVKNSLLQAPATNSAKFPTPNTYGLKSAIAQIINNGRMGDIDYLEKLFYVRFKDPVLYKFLSGVRIDRQTEMPTPGAYPNVSVSFSQYSANERGVNDLSGGPYSLPISTSLNLVLDKVEEKDCVTAKDFEGLFEHAPVKETLMDTANVSALSFFKQYGFQTLKLQVTKLDDAPCASDIQIGFSPNSVAADPPPAN